MAVTNSHNANGNNIFLWKLNFLSMIQKFGVREDRNILDTLKKLKTNCIGQFLRKNCLPKQVIERKVESISGGKARKKT
jgi:hypothetical protein